MGDKALQQGAAFIRIANGKNPLDNLAVHPEAYTIVEKMGQRFENFVTDLIANKEKIALIKPENYVTPELDFGYQRHPQRTSKPGLDPRKSAKIFEFDPNVKSIKDLKTGMIFARIVNNITNFGLFCRHRNQRKWLSTHFPTESRFCERCQRSG